MTTGSNRTASAQTHPVPLETIRTQDAPSMSNSPRRFQRDPFTLWLAVNCMSPVLDLTTTRAEVESFSHVHQ
jgi:hypothetical protein